MKQKFNKNVNFKKSMQNMLCLSVPCDLNADYPFLSLSKALEILTSKRLVEFVVILSFLKNLTLKIGNLAEEIFP